MPEWGDLFEGGRRPLIGMVHLRALPGSPSFDHGAGIGAVVKAALEDVHSLESAGFDAVLFVNEADAPFPEVAPLASAAALAAVVARAAPARIQFGVEFLFDPLASLACAIATGASFIRGGVIGSWETTSGERRGRAAELMRERASARAERIGVFSVGRAEFAFPTSPTSLEERLSIASAEGAMDALLLGGVEPGRGVGADVVVAARSALQRDMPVLANSGVTAANVAEMLELFDGCFVGSDVKVERRLHNPVDPTRARDFVSAARR